MSTDPDDGVVEETEGGKYEVKEAFKTAFAAGREGNRRAL